PVGGSDTHSVLTGHSGLPEATLFTRLHELKIGDTILIDVAGETLAYRVDQTKTVLPDDGADLRQVAGEDYVTLLTCTPTGVNTHRLLVRAERVDIAAVPPEIVELPSSGTATAVPWSAILVLLVGLGIALAVALPRAPHPRAPRL
ncbi:sortase, partial [Pantoea agglomerans]|uniref:sortase n=1 Tax=Enterobacter agglomerans TaxID=549 RepID=UPI003D2E53CD